MENTIKYKENIIVLYSGGTGSFLTAYLLKEKFPDRHVLLFFNDTLTESSELYRFMADTLNFFSPSDQYPYINALARSIPKATIENENYRKRLILNFGKTLARNYANFIYDADGRGTWDIFVDVGFLGNTRIDPCSRILKRERSSLYIHENFLPQDTDIAIGIDWTESDRHTTAKPNWEPYNLIAPLIDFNIDKDEYEKHVFSVTGIEKSSRYELGLPHDNCGGFCVKAGLGHYKLLLKNDRDSYLYHEQKLEDTIDKIGRYPFLRKTVNGTLHYITLREYRIYLETGNLYVDNKLILCNGEVDDMKEWDEIDFGGCGCAI